VLKRSRPRRCGAASDTSAMQGSAFGAPSMYPQANGYGAAYDQENFSTGPLQKGAFLRGQRRRINVNPLFLCILAPWALFTVIYGALSFSLHYNQPQVTWFIVLCGFLCVVVVGTVALGQRVKRFTTSEKEPSWMLFLALTMAIAFSAAYVLGSSNYSAHMRPYFDMLNLNNYTDVYPTRMRGQQLMDAGVIQFTEGTRLDIAKSMGFRNGQVYCVAPITLGNETLPTYDFWAVGTDCCSGSQANFHCPGFNSPHSNGGLRLMSDGARGFYRLAVQQAEATYHIRAVHPLFFEWVAQPMDTVESWMHSGRNEFMVSMFSFFVFQTFLVAVATLAFSKLGTY